MVRVPAERRAQLHRVTRETEVSVTLLLDGTGRVDASTGVGFLDHMLESLGTHARFDLDLSATGDLHVDSHHTVEDVAALLGAALDKALGDRSGIERFGDAVVPMDESLASCAIDCSGRGNSVLLIGFPSPSVGGVPTSSIIHFFEVFARTSQITLHLTASGRDDHHLAEAAFKATARSLRAAVRSDPSRLGLAPSTKGSL
ncbi:MAG: imidazoleglycerol-phosphate dehydratase HisB [Candidatus Dormibacteria bacterium]|jgi:imidazoleglycerol-phosphate dehydratase